MYKEANQALQRAENIIEQTYMITGEIKLLPVALQSVHKAAELAWLETKDNKKPFFLHQMERILEKKKQSPLEFQRKNNFIICTNKLETISINKEKLQVFIQKTKEYIQKCKKKKIAQKKN